MGLRGKTKRKIIDQLITFFMWIKKERGIVINWFTTVSGTVIRHKMFIEDTVEI